MKAIHHIYISLLIVAALLLCISVSVNFASYRFSGAPLCLTPSKKKTHQLLNICKKIVNSYFFQQSLIILKIIN